MRKISVLSIILGTTLLSGCGAASLSSGGTTVSASNQQASSVEYAFTQAGQHPEKKLEEVIGSAKQSLDIAIYSLTKPDIVKAIKDAHQRGVQVRIITDQQEAHNRTQQEALKILKNAGIPIKINTHKGLMHLKVTIADQSIVTTGSYNYTTAASTTNDEVFVVLHDSQAAKDFEAQFNRMWNDTSNFTDWQEGTQQYKGSYSSGTKERTPKTTTAEPYADAEGVGE